MPSHTPVTMQDIANRAKACKSTISLALRNSHKISPEKRAQIQAIARDMGYRPNPLVSAHMAHLRTIGPVRRSGQCIAFVGHRDLADLESDTLTPLQLYYTGAKARAHEIGYELALFNLFAPGMSGRRLSQILVSRGISGVVIGPLSDGMGLTDVTLDWEAFSLAMIEHTFIKPRLHKVCNDEISTIGRLVQRLLDYGFARIGIAMASHMDEHANHYWLAGYQTFQALTGPKQRVPHLITPHWGKDAFLRWYRRWKPEAIITIGSDVVRWLREGGVRVPDDVSCASLYWQKKRAYLSGYYQNHERMGAAAVDLVVEQLNRNERGLPPSEKTILIQAEWKDGSTVRPRVNAADDEPLLVWNR